MQRGITEVLTYNGDHVMKTLIAFTGLSLMALTLVACGSDETTVVHEKPIIVQPAATAVPVPSGGVTPGTVEQMCPNGYNNATRSCY